MSNKRKILAQNIRNYRMSQNQNQFEFAEDCGISRELLSLIECGKENVTIDTMQLLSARMGVLVSDLLTNNLTMYVLIPGQVTLDGTTYTTYGIGAVQSCILAEYIPDISDDYNKVMSLVDLCNQEGLELCHLKDVVENALP